MIQGLYRLMLVVDSYMALSIVLPTLVESRSDQHEDLQCRPNFNRSQNYLVLCLSASSHVAFLLVDSQHSDFVRMPVCFPEVY